MYVYSSVSARTQQMCMRACVQGHGCGRQGWQGRLGGCEHKRWAGEAATGGGAQLAHGERLAAALQPYCIAVAWAALPLLAASYQPCSCCTTSAVACPHLPLVPCGGSALQRCSASCSGSATPRGTLLSCVLLHCPSSSASTTCRWVG